MITYRVTVERVDDADEARSIETLFSAESPSAERLAAFAPMEVAAALRPDAPLTVAAPQRWLTGVRAATPEPPAAAETSSAEEQPAGTKRKRRTRAEMEADRAAAAAAPTSPLAAGMESPLAEPLPRAETPEPADEPVAMNDAPAQAAAPFNPFK